MAPMTRGPARSYRNAGRPVAPVGRQGAAASGAAAADDHTDLIVDIPAVMTVADPATTSDFPKGSVMRANCDFVLRMEAEDGTSQE